MLYTLLFRSFRANDPTRCWTQSVQAGGWLELGIDRLSTQCFEENTCWHLLSAISMFALQMSVLFVSFFLLFLFVSARRFRHACGMNEV